MGLEDRFSNLLNTRKEEQEKNKNSNTSIVNYKKYDKHLDFTGVIEITEDNTLQEFLKNKTREIISIQANDTLKLGEILTEVEKELSKKGSPEASYLKFLNYNGINSKTALRLRKRYELYDLVPGEVKNIIALLSVREIEELYKNKDLLNELNPGIKLLEVKELLKENRIEEETENKIKEVKSINEFNFLNKTYQDKFEDLDLKKQNQVVNLLEKLEKIFKE